MFLLGLEFVFASYAGTRLYERQQQKKLAMTGVVDEKRLAPQEDSVEIERKKNLHYLKISGLTLVLARLSYVSPLFLPAMLIGFSYTTLPYLRVVEDSLRKKKRINARLIYGAANVALLGGGNLMTASLGIGLGHTTKYMISNAEKTLQDTAKNFFAHQPSTVWRLIDTVEIETPLNKINTGDIVLFKKGDVIPLQGVIVSGKAIINQYAVTGELWPVEKVRGEKIVASTQVVGGEIQVRVEKTTLHTVH